MVEISQDKIRELKTQTVYDDGRISIGREYAGEELTLILTEADEILLVPAEKDE